MDMVAVKEEGADIDMTKDGLRTRTDGEYVWAEGTSLGGDDGIAVAYCLALLDSKDIPHPPLEVVITTNEETGMYGAAAIDLSGLKGRKMINIDNEEEGVFIVSCAGGARVYSELTVTRKETSARKVKVDVSGLLGGHSGEMIICGRGNANIIIARTLLEALDKTDFNLIEISGGVADNAIPANATATVAIDEAKLGAFKEAIAATLADIRGELGSKDPDLDIKVTELESGSASVMEEADTRKVLSLICEYPDGVQAMMAAPAGLVETSLNLGILKTEGDKVTIEQSVRSSVESSKNYLIRKLGNITQSAGGEVKVSGSYPGWKFKEDSPLRDHMVKVYTEMYGKAPKVEAIHAGLECGLLSDKLPGLDCISIGPDMQDIHSPKERLSVRSTANVWEYLKRVLA
jgi:dipeptidase D